MSEAKREWNHHPELPIGNAPYFSWPPDPVGVFKWVAMSWLKISEKVIFAGIAIATWFYLAPAIERCVTFQFDWIAQIYLRNLGLIFFVAGGLHLYLYTFKAQGDNTKFDPRDQSKKSGIFTFRKQVWDNMFWTCISGVTVWTAYEALVMWGFANGYAPFLNWSDNPVLFVAWFWIVPFWASFHFYWVHRFLHWPPLYRLAHSLHHRNTNVGPWSGLSMHPVEHVIYLSSLLIHFVVISHPIHLFFHCYWNTLGAATSHSGYESLFVKNKKQLDLGYFFHQLHHRYFECNYGNAEVPWDKLFGSFHDGTPEANAMVKERRRKMMGA